MELKTEQTLELHDDAFTEVLTYLPIASLPALRLVCKHWKTTVIPNAVLLKRKKSGTWKETMVFGCGDDPFNFFLPIWFQKIGPRGSIQHWGSSSLNLIKSPCVSKLWRKHPSLFASEGGLLFFTLNSSINTEGMFNTKSRSYVEESTDEFLVCNPLTGRHQHMQTGGCGE
jgi:hypothetical protein